MTDPTRGNPPYDRYFQRPMQRPYTQLQQPLAPAANPKYKKMNIVHFMFSGGPSYEMMTTPHKGVVQTYTGRAGRAGSIVEFHKALPINTASVVVILSLLIMIAEIVMGVLSAVTLTTHHLDDTLLITLYALALFLCFSVLGAITIYFYAFQYDYTGFISPMVLNITGFVVNGAVLLLILIWLISNGGLPRSVEISAADLLDPAKFIDNAQEYILYEAINGIYVLLVVVHIIVYMISVLRSYQLYCRAIHQTKIT